MSLPDKYDTTFAFISNSNHIYSKSGKRIIPLPMPYYLSSDNTATQLQYSILDENGLTIQAKTHLIQSALSTDKAQITVWGGSLKNGLWAAQYISDDVFEYIATHPWIMPLSEEKLLTWNTRRIVDLYSVGCEDILCSPESPDAHQTINNTELNKAKYTYQELKTKVRNSMLSLADNPITDTAWNMYLNLTSPSTSTERIALQANYLGSTGHLIEASKWYAAKPNNMTTTRCEDIDWDGQNECMMYNDNVFTTFEQDGAVLFSAFIKTSTGLIQLFGPSSQFEVGTGSPEDWKPELGLGADPFYLSGAFFGDNDKTAKFSVLKQSDTLVFSSSDIQKTYQLKGQALIVQVHSDTPGTIFLTLHQ